MDSEGKRRRMDLHIIDPHIHMDAVKRADLEAMSLAGIVAVIADAGPLPALSAQSVLDFYDRTFIWDVPRGTEFLIKTYVTVGINMLCIPPDWEKVIEALPRYLKKENVVGIGEIGVDPRSFTCPDLTKQEEVLMAQLKVVKEEGVPVRLHTPPTDKIKWIEQHFTRIEELGLDKDKVVISHADSEVLQMIINFGCIAEITVQSWRKLDPVDAAKMLRDAPLDRVMVDSDTALRVTSDVLAVPKKLLEMKKLGFKEEEIEKVVYENPRRVFNLD
jgi:predicted metal-dependent TIM-barrel fold hydrolase